MFVLNPGGSGGAGEGGGDFQRQLFFFGRLGLYFVALRAAYLFFAGREESANNKQLSQ